MTKNPMSKYGHVRQLCPISRIIYNFTGEVAQLVGHWFADRKIGSSSPALPTVLKVRDYSKTYAATRFIQCSGNIAGGLNEEPCPVPIAIVAKSWANKEWNRLP